MTVIKTSYFLIKHHTSPFRFEVVEHIKEIRHFLGVWVSLLLWVLGIKVRSSSSGAGVITY